MTKVRVLFVCTGNICRSPTAEGVLRKLLRDAGLDGRVAVDSAGTHGWHAGEAPDARSIRCARRRGYDLSGLRARKVTARDFKDFDLIVALDRGHRDHLRALCPETEAHRLRLFLDYASEPGPDLDVPDPYYGGVEDYERCLDLIEGAMAGLLDSLKRDHL